MMVNIIVLYETENRKDVVCKTQERKKTYLARTPSFGSLRRINSESVLLLLFLAITLPVSSLVPIVPNEWSLAVCRGGRMAMVPRNRLSHFLFVNESITGSVDGGGGDKKKLY